MLRPRSASDSDLPAPMANDWSQPDAAERELARRERERRDGDATHPDLERVLRAVHAVLESQLSARADTARLADDLAAVRAQLAPRGAEPPGEGEEEADAPALATHLAEAEGRLSAQVAHLNTHVQDVGDALPDLLELAQSAAATPGALNALRTTVGPLEKAVKAHTRASNALGVDLKKKVGDAETALTERIAEEAEHVRTALDETTALVRQRRRRSRRFWLGLAGAVLLGLLGCFAGGVWLQWRHAPVPVPDPTLGWRDGIWNDYGLEIKNCIVEARETESTVHCPIAPTQ